MTPTQRHRVHPHILFCLFSSRCSHSTQNTKHGGTGEGILLAPGLACKKPEHSQGKFGRCWLFSLQLYLIIDKGFSCFSWANIRAAVTLSPLYKPQNRFLSFWTSSHGEFLKCKHPLWCWGMHGGMLRHQRGPANGVILWKAKTGNKLTREMEKTARARCTQVWRCIRTHTHTHSSILSKTHNCTNTKSTGRSHSLLVAMAAHERRHNPTAEKFARASAKRANRDKVQPLVLTSAS